MTDTPKTDALREVIYEQYREDELTGNGMGNILAALANIETLERERDEARERLTALCQHFDADGVVDLAVKLLRLERERDNALSDAKQADMDSIRALAERNEAREQLALERALADRLAGQLDDCLQSQEDIGWVMQALAAWKEARND